MTQRKNLLTLTVFAISSLFFGSCHTSGGPANGLSTENKVVWYIPQDIERMNPYLSTDESANYVQTEIWETLTGSNPRTEEDIPLLASLPEISPDHLTYTYTLDPKAHWSDGKPVTTSDIIFNFKVVKNPLLLNGAAQRSFFGTLDSVWSPNGDPSKVAFHWSKFIFNIPHIEGGLKMIPKHIFDPTNITDKITWADLMLDNPKNPALREFQKWFEDEKIGRDPAYLIGSGPYKYQNWITNDRITLKRDSNYWAMDKPWFGAYPEQITFKTIKDLNSALTALKAKDIDIIDGISAPQYLDQLDTSKLPFLRKDTVYVNLYSYMGWNCAKAPFNDKIVRKALTMLINRDQIIHSVLRDMTRKVEGPVPPSQPDFDPTVKQPDWNPDAAKKLLADDGWSMGPDGVLQKTVGGKLTSFKMTFMIPGGSDVPKQICLIIANEFKKAGIEADISQLEWSVYLENLKSHKFDAIIGSWIGNAGVDEEISQIWESNQADNRGSNSVSYKNPVADTLMEHIKIEADPVKRHELSHQFQHIVQEDQPYTFMYSSPIRIGWVDRFDNFELFHSRPPFDPRYWIVRGSGVKPLPTAVPMGVTGDKAAMP